MAAVGIGQALEQEKRCALEQEKRCDDEVTGLSWPLLWQRAEAVQGRKVGPSRPPGAHLTEAIEALQIPARRDEMLERVLFQEPAQVSIIARIARKLRPRLVVAAGS